MTRSIFLHNAPKVWGCLEFFRSGDESLASKMAKGSLSTFVLSMINAALSFVLSVMLARVLGVSEYGVYSYAISWMSIFSVFVRLGFNQLIPRHVASAIVREDWGYIKGLFLFAILSMGVAVSICMAGLWIVEGFYKSTDGIRFSTIWLAFSIMGVTTLMTPFAGFQDGFNKVGRARIPALLALPVSFLVFVYAANSFFRYTLSAEGVLWFQIMASVVALSAAITIFILFVPVDVRRAKPKYDVPAWVKSIVPLIVSGAAYVLNVNVDILLLGTLTGTEAAAIYKVATRGADLVVFSLAIVSIPFAPIIASCYAKGEIERLQEGVTKVARLCFIVALPIAICMIFYGHWFLYLFGEEFQRGTMSLAILSVGQVINTATGAVVWLLTMTGNEKKAALGILIGAVSNIILCLLLIPAFGIEGAAYATAISTVIWNLVLVYYVRSCLCIDPTIFRITCVARS